MIFFSKWMARLTKKNQLANIFRDQKLKLPPKVGNNLNTTFDEETEVCDSRNAVFKMLMGDAKTLDESLKKGMEDLKRIRKAEIKPFRSWSDGTVTMTELYPEVIYKDDTPKVRAQKLQHRKEVDEQHKAMGLKKIRG